MLYEVEEIDPEEGTLCDAKVANVALMLDIEFGPLSHRKFDEEYIEKNDIEYFFKSIIAGLMIKRPADHVTYIEHRLKELKAERDRTKIQLTLIALKTEAERTDCKDSPPEPPELDLPSKNLWTQFIESLHPNRSIVKQELYLDCSEFMMKEECEEEEEDLLKQPVSLYDLASRIVIERKTNMFDIPVFHEPLVLDMNKIANKPFLNFPEDHKL